MISKLFLKRSIVIFGLALIASNLSMSETMAEIVGPTAIARLSDIKPEILPGDWAFLDIDRTLIQNESLIDPMTALILSEWQALGIRVFLVTSRAYRPLELEKELGGFGIDIRSYLKPFLPKLFVVDASLYVAGKTIGKDFSPSVVFESGIFYGAGYIGKGNAILEILRHARAAFEIPMGEMPKRIFFLDDMSENLDSAKSHFPEYVTEGVEDLYLYQVTSISGK